MNIIADEVVAIVFAVAIVAAIVRAVVVLVLVEAVCPQICRRVKIGAGVLRVVLGLARSRLANSHRFPNGWPK